MKSILVTGANGQLGNEIRRAAADFPGFGFLFTDIAELDITDAHALGKFLDDNPVSFIVNCAAYTAVDKAEDDADTAFLLNSGAVKNLAGEAAARKIQLVHVSTDYVFNGEANRPYGTGDPTAPVTVYGRSKLEGETAVRESGRGIIIRTAWLYSVFGHNFVKTILRLSGEKDSLQVVFDQTGSPTNARDLARAILKMIQADSTAQRAPRYEIYHYANEGICSWYEFALEIIRLAGSGCRVEAVSSEQYLTRARRPRYSVLDKGKFAKDYYLDIPHWKSSLADCMRELITREMNHGKHGTT